MDLRRELARKAEAFTRWMESELERQRQAPENQFAAELFFAMEYSMKAGGKRLRPVLLLAAYERFAGCDFAEIMEGAAEDAADRRALSAPLEFALALEMIHTHSLVHDDLPAIDNDELRRGLPTTHVKFGEAAALLAGDALLAAAYDCAAAAFDLPDIEPARLVRALRTLTAKTGVGGMLGGQSVDVQNEKRGATEITREQLDAIYEHKTSALLSAALLIGGILGGADDAAIEALDRIGRDLGLAFQIRDDILDVTAEEETLGKPIRSDEKNGKTTYVTLLGVGGAESEVARLTEQALEQLETLPGDGAFLRELAEYLAGRAN